MLSATKLYRLFSWTCWTAAWIPAYFRFVLIIVTANFLHQGQNSHLLKWADKMNQICSVFLHIHGWHVISSEQASERWGINDGVTEMCSSPICCNAAMFYMLFRTLSPRHRLIMRKVAAVFSKACMRKYVLSELMSSGCFCLCGGPLLLIYRGPYFTDHLQFFCFWFNSW